MFLSYYAVILGSTELIWLGPFDRGMLFSSVFSALSLLVSALRSAHFFFESTCVMPNLAVAFCSGWTGLIRVSLWPVRGIYVSM